MTTTPHPDHQADQQDESVDLWEYDTEIFGWKHLDSGPRTQMAVTATQYARLSNDAENYDAAWLLTAPGEIPPALLDRDDENVFHPYPPQAKAPEWTPLTGMKVREPRKPEIPPEPPIKSVLAWVNEHGYAQVAVHIEVNLWAVSGDEESTTWPEMVTEFKRTGVTWDRIGLVNDWAKLSTEYPDPRTT